MASIYRGALIGCGFFARNHMETWRREPRAEIVAVCDLDPARARAMASGFGIDRVYTDAADMLKSETLDFVDVATTAPSHRQLVCLALAHGIAAICQKPFAETLDDAHAMVMAAQNAGRPLMVHENFRWQRPFRKLQQCIAEDGIGLPHFAHISFRHGYDNYRNQPYLAEIERFSIMDVGLHLFDLARWLMGEVDSLHCRTQRYNPRVRGEDAFVASLRHQGNGVSVLDCSFQTCFEPEPFPETVARIEGERGTLELTRGYQLKLHRAGAVDSIDAAPPVPSWGEKPWHGIQDSVVAIQSHWIDVLDGKVEAQPSGKDNFETLKLALAAYESAATDTVIDLKRARAA
ncbi:MAG: oxidoreductase-like protein [Tardiphaga sp.]|jgi:predicted dehydrogenase|nr:oxidoreductase-like protein [Tardiphaga sp.]